MEDPLPCLVYLIEDACSPLLLTVFLHLQCQPQQTYSLPGDLVLMCVFFSLPKGPSFVSLSAEVGRSLRQEGLIVDF